jgi:hypothetical protein
MYKFSNYLEDSVMITRYGNVSDVPSSVGLMWEARVIVLVILRFVRCFLCLHTNACRDLPFVLCTNSYVK